MTSHFPAKKKTKLLDMLWFNFYFCFKSFLKQSQFLSKEKGSLGPIRLTNIGKFTLKLTIVTKSLWNSTYQSQESITWRHLNKGNEKLKLTSTFNTLLQKIQTSKLVSSMTSSIFHLRSTDKVIDETSFEVWSFCSRKLKVEISLSFSFPLLRCSNKIIKTPH